MTYPALFEPTSPEAEPLWVSNHRRRSTVDFLQTCILTLILCAWTAIHLNVPSPKSRGSWWRRARDKVIWMISAIFVPEIVFVIAFMQYWEARKVCRILQKKARGSQQKGGNLELGFFIVMGGYEGEIQQWLGTLTPRGAILLEQYGALPTQTTAQINDKSKANWLAKCLVCVQATWMVVQCVARKISGLPVTLLELNTVMHVTCALLMYVLWLHKPLDISVPVIITTSEIDKANRIPPDTKDLLCRGSSTRDGRVRDKDERTLMHQHMGLCLGVLSSWVYGGVHLTPWASHFPTVLERILWRASGLIICLCPRCICFTRSHW
ncbi:hypothetical protein EV426DRAFT_568060 [Tirmania nivea]|nr:hypothetical protein EV426DRAFT_568060 [Tirmania nivea]